MRRFIHKVLQICLGFKVHCTQVAKQS